ncbi:hypothetical protein FI667_g1743, partial [Globisporangium splendens]
MGSAIVRAVPDDAVPARDAVRRLHGVRDGGRAHCLHVLHDRAAQQVAVRVFDVDALAFMLMLIDVRWGGYAMLQIGFVVGSSLLVLGLTFEGAIYWGLVAQDNGSREAASIAASVLHGVIFIVQLAVTVVVVQSKEDFIDTYAGTELLLLSWL